MKINLKKCRICKEKFTPFKTTDPVCTKQDCRYEFAMQVVQKNRRSEEVKRKKEKKVALEKLKTHSDWLNELQTIFNIYIRERDAHLPCISCGTSKKEIQYHAGHYLSVSSRKNLRFNEENVHKQCATCNNYLSGNLINYRIGLIKRIGEERVIALENDHGSDKMTVSEIKERIVYYKQKAKELKNGNS